MSDDLRIWFEKTRTEAELHERCESTHPNHEYFYEIEGKPRFWTAWCRLCDRAGFNNDECCGNPNSLMLHEHLATAQRRALNDQMMRAQRPRKLPRCTCPSCGTEHINRKENRR